MDIISLAPLRHNVKYKSWISRYSQSGPGAIHLSGFDCIYLYMYKPNIVIVVVVNETLSGGFVVVNETLSGGWINLPSVL